MIAYARAAIMLLCTLSMIAYSTPASADQPTKEYVGIGIGFSSFRIIEIDEKTKEKLPGPTDVLVFSVLPGSPADRAGIKVDDRITAIDGKSVARMSPDEIEEMLRGPVGKAVTLTIVRQTKLVDAGTIPNGDIDSIDESEYFSTIDIVVVREVITP